VRFDVLSETLTEAGDKVYLLYVPPENMIVIGYIIEGLEGWAFHTIADKEKSILQVEVIRDFVDDFERVMEMMSG